MTTAASTKMGDEDRARLRTLIDRQDILDCLSRISRGADRFDRDQFVSGFHPDAQISAGAVTGTPEETFGAGRAMHDASQLATLHCLANHSCEIEGDVAHAETYYLYVARNRDDINWAAAGRYIDQFERREGAWRIVYRHVALEWSGKLLANEIPMFDTAPADARLRSTRSRDDASYLRPLKP
jgi:hypothetical protein